MRRPLAAAVALALACAACSPRPSRFFTLAPQPMPAEATIHPTGVLGLGPVDIPAYLDRTAIVTRVSDAEVRLSGRDVWSEPLHSAVTRLLAADLQAALGSERVVLYPWDVAAAPPVAVAVDVLQFEKQPGPEVLLVARWRVGVPRQPARLLRETTCREPLAGEHPDTPAVVDAMSRCVAQLAGEIASAVRDVAPGRAGSVAR